MKRKNMFQSMFVILMVGTAIVFSIQDAVAFCLSPGPSRSYKYAKPAPKPETPPPAPAASRTVKEIERDIENTQETISGLEAHAVKEQHLGVINDVKNDQSRGWAKLDGNETYEDAANRHYTEAAATEKEVERLKKKVDRLEQERQTIISQSGGCFLPGTLVTMADGSAKPFEQIRPGDRVLTYDIGYQTTVIKPVVDVYTVEGNHLYTINGELSATGTERLLSDTGWKRVRDLRKGDEVQIDGCMVTIVSVDYHRARHTLYNMQVDDSHNFYVVTDSGNRYLVHNTSSGGGAK